MMMNDKYQRYKELYPFDHRKEAALKKMRKNPHFVPVILEKGDRSSLKQLKQPCQLVLRSMTLAQLLATLRQKLGIENSSQAISLFINNKLMNATMQMEALYEKYADEDGH
eukprot:gene37543-45595_t